MSQNFNDIVETICDRDPRYKEEAYDFVMEALTHTQKKFRRVKHVSGEELLEGIKDLLLERFGPMTLTVLNYWGIKSTEDIGNVVFNLVENKILSKTEDDCIDHFRNGYDFAEVFEKGYRNQLAKKISRMR
jgi:uncharacterized repeat protein (TIGR04138 family)